MKLFLTLFVVAIFGCSVFCEVSRIQRELLEIVSYKYISDGNAEFSKWVEDCYYMSRNPDKTHLQDKYSMVRRFNEYNELRKSLESRIRNRISELTDLIYKPKIGKECKTKYKTQKEILEKSMKFSNAQKEHNLSTNSKKCKKKSYEDDYDDYYDFYNYY